MATLRINEIGNTDIMESNLSLEIQSYQEFITLDIVSAYDYYCKINKENSKTMIKDLKQMSSLSLMIDKNNAQHIINFLKSSFNI